MSNFTINKLWDLRREMDNAIVAGDYNKIKDIKADYSNLTEGERWFSRAFICYNHAFWNDSQRASHNFANINSIYNNIENYEKKYIDGQDVSIKLQQQSNTPFLAGEIWVLRAMFDKFLQGSSEVCNAPQIQQNMILGKAVHDRLLTLVQMEQTESYWDELRTILQEVRGAYECIYGNKSPRIKYSQITEDYIER
ncbi:MAG: hypothetical protein E7356_05410 [Clostridiales bacterium]|nr:hypothetical protein [Clostridiales bacterium]